MQRIISKLHDILNLIKGFEAGYTSSNNKAMLIKNENKVYRIVIEELGEGEVKDFFWVIQ